MRKLGGSTIRGEGREERREEVGWEEEAWVGRYKEEGRGGREKRGMRGGRSGIGR